jgi:hypothetical protein
LAFYNDKKKLNALGVIVIDSKIPEKIKYENIIKDVILKNTKNNVF